MAAPNFFSGKLPDFFPDNRVNLGLDLQGGSHLLLEVDTDIVLQDAYRDAKTGITATLRKNGFTGANVTETENGFKYTVSESKLAEARKLIRKTLSYQGTFDRSGDEDMFIFSEAERNKLHNTAMQRTLQMVRLRVDESGTKEPSIQRQGENRVLLQLPGVDDPARLQELLGKTARLTFHLVNEEVGSRGMTTDRNIDIPFTSKILPMQEEPGRYIVIDRVPMITGEMLTGAQLYFRKRAQRSLLP